MDSTRVSFFILLIMSVLSAFSAVSGVAGTVRYGVIDRAPAEEQLPQQPEVVNESDRTVLQNRQNGQSQDEILVVEEKVSDQPGVPETETTVKPRQWKNLAEDDQVTAEEGPAKVFSRAGTAKDTDHRKEKKSRKITSSADAIKVAAPGKNLATANKLADILEKTRDMEAKFQQQTTGEKGENKIAHGKMALKRPNYFRWEILKPFPQLVVSDATRVWLYDKELEQVTIQKIDSQQGTSPAMVLTGSAEMLAKKFLIKSTELESRILFTLWPKNKESLFEKLQLTFENGIISSINMQDAMGSKTHIQFAKVYTNIGLNKRYFNFKIPKGVDVISDEK